MALRCLHCAGTLFVALYMGLLSFSYSVAESVNGSKATAAGMMVATKPQYGVRLDSLLHTCISATDVRGRSGSHVGVLYRSPSRWAAGIESVPHRWPDIIKKGCLEME